MDVCWDIKTVSTFQWMGRSVAFSDKAGMQARALGHVKQGDSLVWDMPCLGWWFDGQVWIALGFLGLAGERAHVVDAVVWACRILAGDKGGSGRGAVLLGVGVCEGAALFGEAIDVWGFEVLRPASLVGVSRADIDPAQVIGEDENDVLWALARAGVCGHDAREDGDKKSKVIHRRGE